MPVINTNYRTLADVAQGMTKSGGSVETVEMASRASPIIALAPAIECNEGARHLSVIRTGLPGATWTALYEGVPASKSRKAQVHDATARAEGESEVDKRLLKISKDPAQTRLDEAQAHIEGMTQDIESAMIYSDLSDPKKFLGLSPRFGSKSAQNGAQIIDAGGVGSDNMSVWFITWSSRSCHLIYPEGAGDMAAGVQREDKGEWRRDDGNGNHYYVMADHFEMHTGLAVPDWRYVVRIANIDYSDLIAGNLTNILDLMRQAYYQLRARGYMNDTGLLLGNIVQGMTTIHAHRDFIEQYEAALEAQGINMVSPSDAAAGFYPIASSYRGMPIYETDALLTTEARVI